MARRFARPTTLLLGRAATVWAIKVQTASFQQIDLSI